MEIISHETKTVYQAFFSVYGHYMEHGRVSFDHCFVEFKRGAHRRFDGQCALSR
jgi:hypothetical protein